MPNWRVFEIPRNFLTDRGPTEDHKKFLKMRIKNLSKFLVRFPTDFPAELTHISDIHVLVYE